MALRSGCSRFAAALLALVGSAHADSPAFDLSGPRVEVKVTRGGKTLPISMVAPNRERDIPTPAQTSLDYTDCPNQPQDGNFRAKEARDLPDSEPPILPGPQFYIRFCQQRQTVR